MPQYQVIKYTVHIKIKSSIIFESSRMYPNILLKNLKVTPGQKSG